jgi:hypothetical protein
MFLTAMYSLVLVHIGETIPSYFYDCVYQALLINYTATKIYLLIDDSLLKEVRHHISMFNLDTFFKNKFPHTNLVEIIPLSVLNQSLAENENYQDYLNVVKTFPCYSENTTFRDGFWVSTTTRFFYIEAFMKKFGVDNVFHIENDVTVYETFDEIVKRCKITDQDYCYMVQDAPGRVVPSVLYFPKLTCIQDMTKFISGTARIYAEKGLFVNDMEILGQYITKNTLPIFPNDNRLFFDGAAIGQYLGGVDHRNLLIDESKIQTVEQGLSREEMLLYNEFDNPSVGFINERSIMKPNNYNYNSTLVYTDENTLPLKLYTTSSDDDDKLNQIANLHIHSKQLYQFCSVFDIKFADIITGDRVVNSCDFILTTPQIFHFHQNISKFTKNFDISKIIIIKDLNNIKFELLNEYFIKKCANTSNNTLKLFIYTHMLDAFVTNILPKLNNSLQYVLFLHNSDHSLNDKHTPLIESNIIKHIYAQNIDLSAVTNKVSTLPIGIANAMWPHGNLLTLYDVMRSTYKNKKKNSIYININTGTYGYRQNILDAITKNGSFQVCNNKGHREYLEELASHYFCLCVRGNGLDTHRFWESLYLGVIPVIVNNTSTDNENFIKYLRCSEIPFIEISEDDLDKAFAKYNNEYFNKELYNKMINTSNSSIQNLRALKMSHYM